MSKKYKTESKEDQVQFEYELSDDCSETIIKIRRYGAKWQEAFARLDATAKANKVNARTVLGSFISGDAFLVESFAQEIAEQESDKIRKLKNKSSN